MMVAEDVVLALVLTAVMIVDPAIMELRIYILESIDGALRSITAYAVESVAGKIGHTLLDKRYRHAALIMSALRLY